MLNILEDLKNNKLKKVAGDASFRKFYRIKIKNKNYILVHCQKQKNNNLFRYAKINNFLRKKKLLAPKLYKLNIKSNYMIMQDFGFKTYYDVLKKSNKKLEIYKKIISCLTQIQSIKINLKSKSTISQVYSKKILFRESNLFFEWYVSKYIKDKKIVKIFQSKINKILSKIFSKIFFPNNCFVHRDFHVSNLMPVHNKVGIIDSQDSLIGNPAYDVASLVDDVRIKTSPKLKNQILKYYFSKCKNLFKQNEKLFRNDFDIFAVQRGLKIIGIFTRLHVRDKKPGYLSYMPYAWKLLHSRLTNPLFKELNVVLNRYLPVHKRK